MSGLPELDDALVGASGDDPFARHVELVELGVSDPFEDEAGVLVFAKDRVLEPDGDAAASPAEVRSRIKPRSNSARAPNK